MIVQRLPLEIAQRIFRLVERKDLEQILFVCKDWHTVVKLIYYESIALRAKGQIQQLKQHLAVINGENRETHILQQFPMTKRLCIEDNKTLRLTGREFRHLLLLFPNLKSLDVSQSVHRDYYMDMLSDYRSKEMPRLQEIIMKGNDTYDIDETRLIQRFMACYQFRQSLKCLTVAYFHRCVHGKRFMELLPDFQNLSTLEVHNHTNPDTTFFHLLHTMPSLSSLTYMTTLETSTNASQQLENLKCEQSSNPHLLDNLTKVKISLPSLTTPYTDFFTNYGPRNLTDVEICFKDMGIHQWIDHVSLEIALNFFKSLRKFNSLTVKFNADFDYEIDMFYKEMDSFHQVVDVITEERDFRTLSVVHKDIDENNHENSQIQICISSAKLSYEYYFLHPDNYNYGFDNDNSHLFKELLCFLPSVAVSKKLAKVNDVKIEVENTYDDLQHYLEYAEKHLPILKQFQLELDGSQPLHAESLYNNYSLQNMTRITVPLIEHPETLMGILQKYFPKIEMLSLSLGCRVVLNWRDEIFLKLADFQCLHTLTFQVEQRAAHNLGQIYLRYTDHNKNTTHYSLVKNEQVSEYKIEIISAHIMQIIADSDAMRYKHVCIIDIEGPEQLKTIKFANYDVIRASIEF